MFEAQQPTLFDNLAAAIRDPHPLSLLETASALAQVTEPDRSARSAFRGESQDPSVSRDELIKMFLDAGDRETDALLLVWAAMLDRPELATQVLGARRRHSLPRWLRQLDQVRIVRAVEQTHILGDGDNLYLGVETPGRSFTIIAYVDHNLGTIVKDCYCTDLPIREVLSRVDAHMQPDMDVREILLEDAAAKLSQAIEMGDRMLDPYTTDTWPAVKPLVEWMLRRFPAGGEGYVWKDTSDAEWEALFDDFAASEFGRDLDDEAHDQAQALLQFAAGYGTGDPLRWSGTVVEIVLLDLIPRKVVAPLDYLQGMPETLRRVIRYAHQQRSIPATYTGLALAAVDEFTPEYLAAIARPRRQGPSALLERLGMLDPLDDDDSEAIGYFDGLDAGDYLDDLARAVGGRKALDALKTNKLRDEPLKVKSVPGDIVDRVRAVAALADDACDELFEDVELRTATRRALVRIAAADPAIFRRKSSDATAAAALCWIVAKGNAYFEFGDDITVGDLMAHFGLKGSPGQRAQPMLRALGLPEYDWAYDPILGSADLLTSFVRIDLVYKRDRWREGSDEP